MKGALANLVLLHCRPIIYNNMHSFDPATPLKNPMCLDFNPEKYVHQTIKNMESVIIFSVLNIPHLRLGSVVKFGDT